MKKLIEYLAIGFFVSSTSVMSLAYVKYQLPENTAPVTQTTNNLEK